MFSEFSFETASRHPSSLTPPRKLSVRTLFVPPHLDTPLVSPTSVTSFDPALKLAPMDDLSRQLSEHSLHGRGSLSPFDSADGSRRASFATGLGLPTPPNELSNYPSHAPTSYASDEDVMTDVQDDADSAFIQRNYSAISLRNSRQRAVRMQCSLSHLKEIALMVRRRDQCRVGCMSQHIPTSDARLERRDTSWSTVTSRTPSFSTIDGDEHIDDTDDLGSTRSASSDSESLGSSRSSPTPGRGSSEWHGSTTRGCVSKGHRRKKHLHSKRK